MSDTAEIDPNAKRALTPEEIAERPDLQGRQVGSQPDPTARVVTSEDNGADGMRLQPPSFGAKPGRSALDFADDEVEDLPYETGVPTTSLNLVVAVVALAIAAFALGYVLGVTQTY